MRCVLRYILHGLAILSLLLCLATIVLWTRSYWTRDVYIHAATTIWHDGKPWTPYLSKCRFVASQRGVIRIARLTEGPSRVTHDWRVSGTYISTDYSDDSQSEDWCGVDLIFGYPARSLARQWGVAGIERWAAKEDIGTYDELRLPYWLFAVMTLALPLWRMRRWRTGRRRRALGHCIHCGYDLRATPDRCPECGAGSQIVNA